VVVRDVCVYRVDQDVVLTEFAQYLGTGARDSSCGEFRELYGIDARSNIVICGGASVCLFNERDCAATGCYKKSDCCGAKKECMCLGKGRKKKKSQTAGLR
jgi:hypothetical protein